MSKEPVCLVRGSINMDEFFKVPHIVNPGETISSTEYSQRPGGKGHISSRVFEDLLINARACHASDPHYPPHAFSVRHLILTGANQAVAVAASGSRVEFAGSVGSDGAWLKEFLKERGVGTDLMMVHEGKPSGRAIIQTTPDGENAIFLFPGTNHASYPTDKPALQPYHTHLLLQNEILLSDTIETLHTAHQQGVVSIFNPSPMLSPEELRSFPWEKLSVLVVNQGEANVLLGALGEQGKRLDSGESAVLSALVALPVLSGLSGIIVTLGGSGAIASFSTANGRETIQLPAARVKVKDTTGAGDTFLGFLCGSLMRITDRVWDLPQLKMALQTSIVAAGLSTQQPGAMSSIPSKVEVESQLAAYLN